MDDIPVIRWSVAMERNDIGGFVNYHDYTMLYERIESMREDMQRRIRIGKESSDEIDALRARVAELERERDQLALSLSATRAERDHAVRSAELWESEHRASYEAMGVYKHLWLEGRAIMAVCGYFSRMRGPDAWITSDDDGYIRFHTEMPEWLLQQFPTAVPLYAGYAGYAPVPAAQMDNPDVMARATAYARDIVTWLHRDHYADNTQFEPFDDLLGLLSQIDNMICGWKEQPAVQEVDVAAICNAYESGVGHRGRPTANVNPYREGTPEHEAYAIGAGGEAAPEVVSQNDADTTRTNMIDCFNGDAPMPTAVPEAVAKDAERYRWVRSRSNSLETRQYDKRIYNGPSCYHEAGGIRELKSEGALDAAIDAAMLAAKAKGGAK